jgi:DNA-directed RNA polymerase specialized sigma24 family protein
VLNDQVQYDRERSELVNDEKQSSTTWLYSIDTNLVRDKYRDFERQAGQFGFSRQPNETVREWFKRQEWQVSERFYEVYDMVRYSGQQMDAQDGEWFMNELQKLLLKYFDNEV